MKPRVFVASSKEGQRVALAVQQNLEEDADITLWSQDALRLGATTIDELTRNLQRSKFGIFVFSADDTVTIRGKQQKTVRDNVILELGIFIGRLGKEHCFIVRPKAPPELRLPTDLLGVITAQYDPARSDEVRAALGPACVQIADAMKRASPAPGEARLNQLVLTSLEIVCRAMSVPTNPTEASLRVFIFRKEGDELVCRHFWDPNPSKEEVGKTRFHLTRKAASRIVVVQCFLDNEMRRTEVPEGAGVAPLPKDFEEAEGAVNPGLTYVLAAPIRDREGKIWGVVDFDASNEAGKSRLETPASKTVILRLAEQLSYLTYEGTGQAIF